jgi:hypothetical protein
MQDPNNKSNLLNSGPESARDFEISSDLKFKKFWKIFKNQES